MKFSKRIQNIQPSMTLATEATARALRARGEDVIGFGAGEPDFASPENIKQAGIAAINKNDTHYTPVGGTEALKQAIISKLDRENGLSYEPGNIVVSCGAKHSIYNLANVLWEEGDDILVPAPYWVSYPEIIRLTGARPIIIEASGQNEFKITPSQIAESLTPNSRAIILNSPSNPTGSAYTASELEAIAEEALKHNLLIISDEIYEKIVFDGFKQISIASLSKEVKENTVVINGVSKSYAMTGWRIGYMAGNEAIMKQVNKLQGQSTSNPTSISQAAAVEALSGSQDEVDRMVAEFLKRRNILLEGLLKIPGISCYRPVGSFYTFPDFSAHYGKTYQGEALKGSIDFTQFLLNEGKVALVPGIAFGADCNARMSFATSPENIMRGVERIGEAIGRLQ